VTWRTGDRECDGAEVDEAAVGNEMDEARLKAATRGICEANGREGRRGERGEMK
jgi:hypothetical protein